jgi:hypothetical protein
MRTSARSAAPELEPAWAKAYPQRWAQEFADLVATGWSVRVVQRGTVVVLDLEWPGAPDAADAERSPEGAVAPRGSVPAEIPTGWRLEVTFPSEYPFFPPQVRETGVRLGLRRHRGAAGQLCLVESEDWHPDTTVARMLNDQLPQLLAAGLGNEPPAAGTEVLTPEPVTIRLAHRTSNPTVVLPDAPVPAGIDEGALVAHFLPTSSGQLGAGLVEGLHAPGFYLAGPAARRVTDPLVVCGRWARDPDFDPAAAPAQTWQRLDRRLRPLQFLDTTRGSGGLDPIEPPREEPGQVPAGEPVVELLCLLVPSEEGYRTDGEAWIVILKVTANPGHQANYHYLESQTLGPDTDVARSPDSALLGSRRVVLAGVGALGGHVATDLARSGIGRLDLVDGDVVDVGTGSRQYAPPVYAGRPKVETIAAHLWTQRPHLALRAFPRLIGHVHDPDPTEASRKIHFDAALRGADLLIDATASPAVTRYLAAVRHASGRPFLHLSATSGAWGGSIFLTRPRSGADPGSGCWACLQHHRADHAVPVPPADPAGLITLAGCASATFTGTNADLATIAHHASRVALDHLLDGDGLGGNLHVAHLRDPHAGRPHPVRWETSTVPIHPECPLHLDTQLGPTRR